MARASLGDLLGNLAEEKPAEPQKVVSALPADRPKAKQAARETPTQKPRAQDVAVASEVSYLDFIRKDTRLREDQLDRLTREARRLNRAKRNTGVRITDNTLIRIGVDLLLDRIEKAHGDDEAALRKSLS